MKESNFTKLFRKSIETYVKENNGTVFIQKELGYGVKAGWPDLFVTYKFKIGEAVYERDCCHIEIKTTEKTRNWEQKNLLKMVTERQRAVMNRLIQAGAFVYIVIAIGDKDLAVAHKFAGLIPEEMKASDFDYKLRYYRGEGYRPMRFFFTAHRG